MDGIIIVPMLWPVYCWNKPNPDLVLISQNEEDFEKVVPDPVQTSQNEGHFENEVDLNEYWLVNCSLEFLNNSLNSCLASLSHLQFTRLMQQL